MKRIAFLLTMCLCTVAHAQVRVKDITDVEGARANQLYGLGLVVGLDGTGGRSSFSQGLAVEMLQKMDVTGSIASQLPTDAVFKSTNISVVMVTAEIGPFARRGSRIDVTVSAMDDAKSLQGGLLLLTPLRGVDKEVYAVAQGPLSVGGFTGSGQAAAAQKNHVNIGRIPGGAIVEKEALGRFVRENQIRLLLREPDFNTSRLIAKAINERFRGMAQAVDGGTIAVCLPFDRQTNPTGFVSELGLFEVSPDMPARIVINERTGTVVAGEHVTVSTTAVAHGNLFIVTAETPEVSQPAPFSKGKTTVVPRTNVDVTEQKARLTLVPKSVTVADVARALNALGVTPRDLISIFQALKQAGAIHAEIIIM